MTQNNGLSTVELLITLAITAILVAFTLPSLTSLFERYRLETGLQAMARSLATARSEAIKYADRVSMVGQNGQWELGWELFVDRNGNGVPDEEEPMLYHQQPFRGITIRGNSTVQSLITYRSDGASVLPNNGFQAGTLHICTMNSDIEGYKIVLGRGGRTYIQRLPQEATECAGATL